MSRACLPASSPENPHSIRCNPHLTRSTEVRRSIVELLGVSSTDNLCTHVPLQCTAAAKFPRKHCHSDFCLPRLYAIQLHPGVRFRVFPSKWLRFCAVLSFRLKYYSFAILSRQPKPQNDCFLECVFILLLVLPLFAPSSKS